MPFTFDEIQREWFGGDHLRWDPIDAEHAFNTAEEIRGRAWVLGTELDLGGAIVPGIGRRGGFSEFLRVWWFGKRVRHIIGAPGSKSLLDRLLADDASANSELTAIYLLRERRPSTEVQIAPPVAVGAHDRHPDFQIREPSEPWTYVEVTKLRRSVASERIQGLLDRICDRVISIIQPFLLEVVFWRDPKPVEEDEVIARATDLCGAAQAQRVDVGDVATVIVKLRHPSVAVPSILPTDDGTRMSAAKSVVGPGEANRQIIVRAPFADQRAEDVLTAAAKQLPRSGPGLIMVDAASQPTAFESWQELVPKRFTPRLHTRVGGVILFMFAMSPTAEGIAWLPYVSLIANPHGRHPLPAWVTQVIQETRAEARQHRGLKE